MAMLAILILTYNVEANITECIKSAQFADEIVVIDSGSTDKTIEIATSLGVKCIFHSMREGFAAQRNFALTQTNAEWVMFLDADERITSELSDEIRSVISNQEAYSWEILRVNILFGQRVYYGGHSPDWSLRLYPRTAIRWEGSVHEKALVTLPVRKLKNTMLHYTYTTWDRYLFKLSQYTSLMAQQMFEHQKKARFIDIVFRPWFAFLRFYLLKSGWRDGKIGFIMAVFHGFYTMTKYVRLYTLHKQKEYNDESRNF